MQQIVSAGAPSIQILSPSTPDFMPILAPNPGDAMGDRVKSM